MTVQISLKRNDGVFHTGPWFWPFVSWQTNPNVWTFRIWNFQQFGCILHCYLGICRHCVCCLSVATRESGYDVHDFSCCHFEMLKIFVQWILRKTLSRLLHFHHGVQLDPCIFGASPPNRQSSNDRCPSVRQNELLRPSSLLHRSPLIYFWLLSDPTPDLFLFLPLFIHCCFRCRNFHSFEA